MENSMLVTIGHPLSEVPILPFLLVNVEGSVAKVAKKVRKQVAENPKEYSLFYVCDIPVQNLVPADLFWACYHNTSDETPFEASDNFWCREALRKEYEEKVQKESQERLARYEEMLKLTEDDKKFLAEHHRIPQDEECPHCGCHGFDGSFCVACDAEICQNCQGVLDECGQCDNCGYGL